MTVQYSTLLVTKKYFGFARLLFLWHGSIYKLIWKDIVLFLVIYYGIYLLNGFILSDKNKRQFNQAVVYCNSFSNLLPLQFILGFFVNRVYSRFWEHLNGLPWPVKPAIYVSSYLRGHSDESRMMRRSIVRYLVLSLVMTLASICPRAKKRFPTMIHMTEAGFLLPKEQELLESMSYAGNKYLIPCVWAAALVERARQEGKIKDDLHVQKLINEINDWRGACGGFYDYDSLTAPLVYTQEINDWRGACGGLFGYDSLTVPLVYTQIITVAVYTFVIACLVGRRETDDGVRGDFNFPFFTLLNLIVYIGWMKVAESMFNPFGDDDDDFEINALIDRHLQEAYLVVDTIYESLPEMVKDLYWNQTNINMPYTAATQHTNRPILLGSAVDMDIPEKQQQFLTRDDLMNSKRQSIVARLSGSAIQRASMQPSESNVSPEASFHTAVSDRQLPTPSTSRQIINTKTEESQKDVTSEESKSSNSQTNSQTSVFVDAPKESDSQVDQLVSNENPQQ